MTATRAPDDVRVDLMAIGVPVVVNATGSGARHAAAEIARAWARCVIPPNDAPLARIEVVLDDDPAVLAAGSARGAVVSQTLPQLLHDFSPHITTHAIARQATSQLLMLHAGGLADESGRVVALVAASGVGKTTAVSRLARTFGYVTDETVAVQPDLSVVAYPKPLSVLDRDDGLKSQHAPDEAGLTPTPATCRLGALVCLDRRPDGPLEPEVEEMDVFEALAALAPQTSYLAARPGPLRQLAALVDATGGMVRLHYREADRLVPALRQVLAR
ncbi:MAG: hypothetical protein F2667_12230 [Actinobacteria bacterium]|nr:hypothetical protein [Actinomycetota bacterium]